MANSLPDDYRVTILQITQPGELVAAEPTGSFHEVISEERGKGYTPLKLIRGLVGPTPITVLNYTFHNVAAALQKTLQSCAFDVVQMESIHLFRYLDIVRQTKIAPAVVLDWHNIESELMRRYAERTSNPAKKFVASRTARLLERLEDTALGCLSAHTVVSNGEREKLLARNIPTSIHVIANGVDTAAFRDHPVYDATSRQTLLFVGSMDYHANADAVIWFCREIWPQLAREFPNVDFKIVGRNPPASVQALASPRIVVTGTVEDVRPYYQSAFAAVAPLRFGGGTRLKVLEAMAAGVPVISTSVGAEGLDIEDKCEILVANTAATMSAAIRGLLSDPGMVQRLRDNARRLIHDRYEWKVVGKKLAAVYASLRK